jgi:hypothetical protein
MRPGGSASPRSLAHAVLITAVLAWPAFAQSPIVIVSPAPSEFVDARVPYTVRWESPDIRRNTGFFVYYVHDSLRHAICEAPPTARECVWADPPSPTNFSGTLFVEARAVNGTAIAVTESELFYLHEGFLPNPWVGSRDVGDVGVPGSVERNQDDSTIVIRGSGAGIGGTADAFHYFFTQIVGGDAVNMRATITAIDGPPGTQVGLMVNNTSDPGSTHDFLAVGAADIVYVRRFDENGPTVRTIISERSALPIPIQLMRRDNYTELNVMVDGVWQRAGRSFMGSNSIGFAITSGVRDVLATATLENVRSDTDSFPAVWSLTPQYGAEFVAGAPLPIAWTQREPHPVTLSYSLDNGESWTPIPECTAILATSCVWNDPIESEAARIRADFDNTDDRTAWTISGEFVIRPGTLHPLPSGWTSRDVGDVAAAGFATYSSEHELFAVAGSGAGISGSADEFHFVSRPVVQKSGEDVEITARVASTELGGPSQVGLMVRARSGARATHVSVLVPTAAFSPTQVLTFARRRSEGGATITTLGPAVADPAWIRFVVSSGEVQAYYREASNAPWRFLGSEQINLGPRYEAGLAVSGANDGTLGRGTFDNVTVRNIRR